MTFDKLPGRWITLLSGLAALLAASSARAEYELNMTQGVTPIAHELYSLHMIVFWICVVIGVLVFGVMGYSILHHRKSKGAESANFHESTTVEIIWTVVPLIILVIIAVPATSALLDLEDSSGADIDLQVTGIQWKWKYTYLDEDVSIISSLAQSSRELINGDPTGNENYLLEVDKPIVLPINKKIRFLFHSDDVIHAWWVPELAVKQDAIPGFINDSWTYIEEPGTYRGQCAELCGKDHGFMPIVVQAVTEDEYDAWIAEQKAAAAAEAAMASQEFSMQDLVARGEAVYQANCMACHGPTGAGVPGVFPALTGSAIATDPDPSAHIDIVVNGKAGTAMAAYKGQLGDVDIAAVVTYERNSLGNSVGDMVQPSAIQNAR